MVMVSDSAAHRIIDQSDVDDTSHLSQKQSDITILFEVDYGMSN